MGQRRHGPRLVSRPRRQRDDDCRQQRRQQRRQSIQLRHWHGRPIARSALSAPATRRPATFTGVFGLPMHRRDDHVADVSYRRRAVAQRRRSGTDRRLLLPHRRRSWRRRSPTSPRVASLVPELGFTSPVTGGDRRRYRRQRLNRVAHLAHDHWPESRAGAGDPAALVRHRPSAAPITVSPSTI